MIEHFGSFISVFFTGVFVGWLLFIGSIYVIMYANKHSQTTPTPTPTPNKTKKVSNINDFLIDL